MSLEERKRHGTSRAHALALTAALLTLAPTLGDAGGWYLLVPPDESLEKQVYGDRKAGRLYAPPLKYWEQLGAFDSAAACEAGHRAAMEDAEKIAQEAKKAEWEAKTKRTESARWKADRAVYRTEWGRCVASDDPRLR